MVKINVFNSKSHVECEPEEYEICQHILSYFVEGSKFSNNAFWDGRIRLLKKNWFPTGLLSRLQKGLNKHEIAFEVTDHRVEPPMPSERLKINPTIKFRDYQSHIIELTDKQPRGIIVLGTGGGKSITLGGIVASKSVPTLIITPDTGLREQLYETVSFMLGKKNVSFDIESDAPIVVSNIQALVRKKPEAFKRFLMLCTDEFHHCLNKDTLVGDMSRKGRTIEDIYNKFHRGFGVKVKSWDGEKWSSKRVLNAFKYKSPAKILKVKIQDEDGKIHTLEITDNHKVLTDNGKVEIGKLKVGDELTLGYTTHKEAMRNRSKNEEYKKHLSKRATKNNPLRSKEVRASQSAKIKQKIKNGEYNPYGRGKFGNGRELTKTQKELLKMLPSAVAELSVATRDKELPYHYKIDVALPEIKLAIEIDGSSHKNRKEQDDRKDKRLGALGWKVVRIPEGCSKGKLLALKNAIQQKNMFTI